MKDVLTFFWVVVISDTAPIITVFYKVTGAFRGSDVKPTVVLSHCNCHGVHFALIVVVFDKLSGWSVETTQIFMVSSVGIFLGGL